MAFADNPELFFTTENTEITGGGIFLRVLCALCSEKQTARTSVHIALPGCIEVRKSIRQSS